MLHLNHIIDTHGLQRQAIAHAAGLSASAFSRLVHEGYWPKTKTPDAVQAAIEHALHNAGVSREEMKTAWTVVETAQTANVTNAITNEGNHMSKPVLTQGARRALNLSVHQGLFENDMDSMSDVYETDHTAYVRAHLRNAGLNGGFIAVISEPGGGKTTLANDLEDYCIREKRKIRFIRPDHINVEKLAASGIYDAIIDDVSEGTEKPKRTLEYKARQAKRLLTSAHAEGTRHVLILEEAQGLLPNTLKNLKRFWEIRSGHQNVLGIVLIGQTELRRHLSDDAWNTREVALRCQVLELKPLTPQQVEDYLALKFSKVGLSLAHVFEPEAYAAIHARLQDGSVSFCYPQRINNLVVRVLNKWAEIGTLVVPLVNAELIGMDLRLRSEV